MYKKRTPRKRLLLFINLRAAKNYLTKARMQNIEPQRVNDSFYSYSIPRIPVASSCAL